MTNIMLPIVLMATITHFTTYFLRSWYSGQVSRASEHSGEHGIDRETDRQKEKTKKIQSSINQGSASFAPGVGFGLSKGAIGGCGKGGKGWGVGDREAMQLRVSNRRFVWPFGSLLGTSLKRFIPLFSLFSLFVRFPSATDDASLRALLASTSLLFSFSSASTCLSI